MIEWTLNKSMHAVYHSKRSSHLSLNQDKRLFCNSGIGQIFSILMRQTIFNHANYSSKSQHKMYVWNNEKIFIKMIIHKQWVYLLKKSLFPSNIVILAQIFVYTGAWIIKMTHTYIQNNNLNYKIYKNLYQDNQYS